MHFMQPLVSILIPAYNSQEWLADTLESAIAQTWPRKEIIVVDDGSRDHTAEVARRFTSKEVAVVTTKNQGAAAARNHAMRLSQGDYIQWLDADDLLAPEKVERQIAALRELFCLRRGLSSIIEPNAPGSFQPLCGKTFLPRNGSGTNSTKIYTCKRLPG